MLNDILLNIAINKRRLKPNAVPSIMMNEKPKEPAIVARENRLAASKRNQTVESTIADNEMSVLKMEHKPLAKVDLNCLVGEESPSDINSVANRTEVEINCAREFKSIELEEAIKLLKQENAILISKCAELSQQIENMKKSLGEIFTDG